MVSNLFFNLAYNTHILATGDSVCPHQFQLALWNWWSCFTRKPLASRVGASCESWSWNSLEEHDHIAEGSPHMTQDLHPGGQACSAWTWETLRSSVRGGELTQGPRALGQTFPSFPLPAFVQHTLFWPAVHLCSGNGLEPFGITCSTII